VVFVHRRTLPVLGFNSLGKNFEDTRAALGAGTGQSNIFLQFAEVKSKQEVKVSRQREGTIMVNNMKPKPV